MSDLDSTRFCVRKDAPQFPAFPIHDSTNHSFNDLVSGRPDAEMTMVAVSHTFFRFQTDSHPFIHWRISISSIRGRNVSWTIFPHFFHFFERISKHEFPREEAKAAGYGEDKINKMYSRNAPRRRVLGRFPAF
jgi:hypothetical protein